MSDAPDEEVNGFDGGTVRVTRDVPFHDREDGYRPRTVAEFAAALVEAAGGLDDTRVDGHLFYETVVVTVEGTRAATEAETAEHEARERAGWLAAKARYDEGVAKGYRVDAPDAGPVA